MPQESLEELFVSALKDLYSAETQLIKALPRMAKAAHCEELQKGFEDHLQVTKNHVKRLDEIFVELGKKPEGKKCKAMEGLIKEGEEVIEENMKDSSVLDAGLICAAQKAEHYEISGYGTAKAWADTLGMKMAVGLLEKTLEEEKKADVHLTTLATGSINTDALNGSEGSANNGQDANDEAAHADNRSNRAARGTR